MTTSYASSAATSRSAPAARARARFPAAAGGGRQVVDDRRVRSERRDGRRVADSRAATFAGLLARALTRTAANRKFTVEDAGDAGPRGSVYTPRVRWIGACALPRVHSIRHDEPDPPMDASARPRPHHRRRRRRPQRDRDLFAGGRAVRLPDGLDRRAYVSADGRHPDGERADGPRDRAWARVEHTKSFSAADLLCDRRDAGHRQHDQRRRRHCRDGRCACARRRRLEASVHPPVRRRGSAAAGVPALSALRSNISNG